MAQGQFTKEEAKATREAFDEIINSLSRNKKMEFIGHMNDIYLFLSAAEKAAPAESEVKEAA